MRLFRYTLILILALTTLVFGPSVFAQTEGAPVQATGTTVEEAPGFEFGIDVIANATYSDYEELKLMFNQPSTPNGFSVLLIKNTALMGFGVSYMLAETQLTLPIKYQSEDLKPTFRSSYNVFNLIIDVPTRITNLSIFVGAGQYNLSCNTDDEACDKKAFKDAKFPSGSLFSSGGRISLNFGAFYKIYVSYLYINTGKVTLKQKESEEIKDPQAFEYDPSVSVFSLGFSFLF